MLLGETFPPRHLLEAQGGGGKSDSSSCRELALVPFHQQTIANLPTAVG